MAKRESLKMVLPIKPLSINQAWQGRRFKTKEYKQFCQDVRLLIPGGTPRLTGFVEIKLIWYLKNWLRTDWDNPIKPLMDVLVSVGIIEDDRKILRGTVEKRPAKEDRIEIRIRKINRSEIIDS